MKPLDKKILTAERIRELLHYDAATGLFTWKVSRARTIAGTVAGNLNYYGYIAIGIDRRLYLAHRLVWLYVFGEWPTEQIDHIDGRRNNNALMNLRACTHEENTHNRGVSKKSTSGFSGVHFKKDAKKWQARIGTKGKRRHLGYFSTIEEAKAAYIKAKQDLHPFNPVPRYAT